MSLHLRALVSGIPEPRRSQRLLFMLQALIDESVSFGSPRVFVLAGYIATVERWEKLAIAWEKVLKGPPRLEYFSFREAYPASKKPNGQFNNMSLQERDRRVAALRTVIEVFVLAEICIGFVVDAYEKAFAGLDRMAKNPYYLTTSQLEVWTARNLEGLGLQRQQLDFIYDNKKIERAPRPRCMVLGEGYGNPEPPDLFEKILTNAPSFRSSRDLIALQAADMLAGWVRSFDVAELRGKTPWQIPGYKRDLPSLVITYTDEMLVDAANRIRTRNKATSS